MKRTIVFLFTITLFYTVYADIVKWESYHTFKHPWKLEIYNMTKKKVHGAWNIPPVTAMTDQVYCDAGDKMCLGTWDHEGHQLGSNEGNPLRTPILSSSTTQRLNNTTTRH